MKGARRILYSVYVSLSVLAVAGCASTLAGVTKGTLDKMFADKPPKLSANLEASPELNPDYEGKPSPLVVRLYELTSITEFNAAQFFALYDRDTELLAQDLKAREEMVVLPAETREFERELNMETRYVGIIGAYRDLEKAVWRASVKTPIDETTAIL